VKKLVLVGNASLNKDMSAFIDASDVVIRFNDARTLGVKSGFKTDILCVRNTGGPALCFIANKSVKKYPKFPDLSEVWFPRNGDTFTEYSEKIIESNELCDVKIRRFSKELNNKVFEKLVVISKSEKIYPSSGFLALSYILETSEFDQYEKYIVGFTFDMWEGHPAKAERILVETYCKQYKDLHFIPVTHYNRIRRIIKDSKLYAILRYIKGKITNCSL